MLHTLRCFICDWFGYG